MEAQEDTTGYLFTLSLKDQVGVAFDLSVGSPTVTLYLYDPVARTAAASHGMTITAPAANGIVTYSTAGTDMPNPGGWKGQVRVQGTGFDYPSEQFDVAVGRNLY